MFSGLPSRPKGPVTSPVGGGVVGGSGITTQVPSRLILPLLVSQDTDLRARAAGGLSDSGMVVFLCLITEIKMRQEKVV